MGIQIAYFVFVIFLTLGGREFFEYFDVGITKKNASENANVTETKANNNETKENQVTVNHENNKDQEDKIQEKEQKDDKWSEFN